MKICHVVYECTPGRFAGGVQKMVLEVATAQAEAGHQVEIWTLGKPREITVNAGLRIRYFQGGARRGAPALSRALGHELDSFAVIHAHNTFLPLNVQVAMCARRGAKVFFHAHGALDPQLLAGWNFKAAKKRLYVNLLERRNYDAAQAVFGLTPIECGQIQQIGTRTAIYEVSNGIRPQRPAAPVERAAFRIQNRIRPDQPVILFVGRITHKKGIHYLLDAMDSIRREVPDAVLVICGGRDQDRDYVTSLDLRIERLGIAGCVRWGGFVNEDGKRAAFGACTVFAHPSYSEGMAMAVLEAMSFGVPSVVTPGCYMDAAVEAGALVLAEQTSASLSAVIVDLLKHPAKARQMGETGKHYIAERHTWPRIAERLTEIYTGDGKVAPYRARQV